MNKIVKRLLIFFICLPLIGVIVLLLPHYSHLVLNLIVIIFSALGAMEFSASLAQKQLPIPKAEAAILGSLLPLAMFLNIRFGFGELLIPAVVTAVISWLLVSRIFSRNIDLFINQFAAGLAVLLYPGMFLVWLVRMSRWEEHSGVIILFFLAAVFCTDGMAWAMGMLFGKGNRGVIPVSPKKSVAGFIGAAFASIVVGMGAVLIFPEIFNPKYHVATGAVLGLLTGAAAVFGDLGESAIKRSSGLKDSGSIIPGRGGVLDSIDSIALAAPVFYLAYCLLFVQP
ncbi:MAG: phosphatidate cytidylyltransferase [Treponema sp.]|nr:phosphatidate cytidylyltransferase [Treponema sp.]